MFYLNKITMIHSIIKFPYFVKVKSCWIDSQSGKLVKSQESSGSGEPSGEGEQLVELELVAEFETDRVGVEKKAGETEGDVV